MHAALGGFATLGTKEGSYHIGHLASISSGVAPWVYFTTRFLILAVLC